MMHRHLIALAIATPAAIAAAAAPQTAAAQDVGQHPAVFAPRQLPGIDPNTFVVGHPASPRNRVVHANAEHPAVLVAAAARAGSSVDSNTFLVQPPASVRWALQSAPDTPLLAASSQTIAKAVQ